MKRLVFALAVVAAIGACKKAEQQQPAQSAPDTSQMLMSDSSKMMMSDSSKMTPDTTKQP